MSKETTTAVDCSMEMRKEVERSTIANALKLLSLFRRKGLLCDAQFYVLKEALLTSSEVLDILEGYDLHALSDNANINHLMDLFNKLEVAGKNRAQAMLNPLFDDDCMNEAHQIANATSVKTGDVRNKGEGRNFVYGEIEYEAFSAVLDVAMVGLKRKCKFVDLGAGLGKACLWVAMTTAFDEVLGIEIIDDLVTKSHKMLSKFQKNLDKKDMKLGSRKFDLIQGDFLSDEHEWEEADLIFANSTCFTEDLMMKLSVKSQACKPGTRFITFTASLDSPYWKVIYKQQLAMSWGPATVFVHLRLSSEEVQTILRSGTKKGGHQMYDDPSSNSDDDDDEFELISPEEENKWLDGNAIETEDFIVL